MPKIADKIKSECRSGTYIMSYRFLIPCINDYDLAPTADESINSTTKFQENGDDCDTTQKSSLDATLIYEKNEMRIYQLMEQENK